jgi:hypothetical protein
LRSSAAISTERNAERDSGVELSRATPDGWVLKADELLIPMASAMRQELCYLLECVQPAGTWGQSNSATNRLSTIRNGMGHFCSAIGWSLSSPDLTFQDNFLPSFCWLILLMSWRSCGGSGRRFFSRSRKAKEMDPRRPSPAVSLCGKGSTQKKFQEMLPHAAREGGISFGRCCVLKLSRQR